ncbi:MAG: hypothetical protein ACK5PS_02920 [Desulfopila sp.]
MLLIPIQGDFVAPRFDLATEVFMAQIDNGRIVGDPKTIISERPSEEWLCQLAVEEHITDVVCGGIEELHYNFLVWKKVKVLDSIIGAWRPALDKMLAGSLAQGEIFIDYDDEGLSL